MATAQELLTRHSQLRQRRQYYETTLQDIADYILPRKRGISSEPSEGEKQTEKIFDSTAIFANEILAARLVATSPRLGCAGSASPCATRP